MKTPRLRSLLCSLLLIVLFVFPASAKSNSPPESFRDIPSNSPLHDAVSYAAQNEITLGTGDNCFSPQLNITALQWSTFLCRAFHFDISCKNPLDVSFEKGWLSSDPAYAPTTFLSYEDLFVSAFCALQLPVYNIYADSSNPYDAESCYYAAIVYGLCSADPDARSYATRGDAIQLLFLIMTQRQIFLEPSIIEKVHLRNDDHTDLLPYLKELELLPASILDEYYRLGWEFHVNSEYVEERSKAIGVSNCIGLTSTGEKAIYAKKPSTTLHEFGHFLFISLGRPSEVSALYEEEGKHCSSVLRAYSEKSANEYFADYFRYYLKNNSEFNNSCAWKTTLPNTFHFFQSLESASWGIGQRES